METVLGFVAGYLAGTQEGPDGLKRLRESVKAIMTSAEVRRLAGEALTLGEAVARQAASRGLGGLGGSVGEVADVLVHRAGAVMTGRERSRAA
jgi:hypothetical protein